MTSPPQRLWVRSGKLPASLLRGVAIHIRSGAVAVFPTETVYGVGANAFSLEGIRRIYKLKGRRWNKPLALLVPSLKAALPLAENIPEEAHRLAEAFWPGPLTLVLAASALGKIVTGGLDTIGVRVPRHPVALALLKTIGVPMAATSVNRSGERPAVSGEEAWRLFGPRVDHFLDGGICPVKTASSVVDLSSFPFTVRREGAIAKVTLERVLFTPSCDLVARHGQSRSPIVGSDRPALRRLNRRAGFKH